MKKISPSRIITGLLILAIGVGLLLSNLNVLNFGDLARDWWPMIIVTIGVIIFLDDMKNYLWALIVTAFGVVTQLHVLDVLPVNAWQLVWPIIIIAVGVSILVNRAVFAGSPKGSAKISKADREDVTAILSGSEQKNHSTNFKASKITAIMGGAQVDLRKAIIKKEATVEIFTLMGGVELIVPEGVEVKCSTSNILGGIEDKTIAPAKKDAPILYVIGDVIMAGVEIKN